jgi:hypothetical protein
MAESSVWLANSCEFVENDIGNNRVFEKIRPTPRWYPAMTAAVSGCRLPVQGPG